MGLIATLLEFTRTTSGDAQVADCRADPGGTDDATAHSYQPAGFDGSPLPGDYCLLVPGPEAGSWVVAGFIDPDNAGTAEAGETRLYARDGGGNVVGTLRLKNNGDVHLAEDTAAALIARADRTDTELSKVKTALGGHTHVVSTTGSATAQSGTAAPSTDHAYEPAATGCDKVYGT
ncbi:MAG: hypothetical protein WBM40_05355 [Thiohalocapsa sp.]